MAIPTYNACPQFIRLGHGLNQPATITRTLRQLCMLIEDPAVREVLRAIVSKSTRDPSLHEDLLQECLVRLWEAERDTPGKTRSWYLQNCRFHLQHCLAQGRSIDSLKRSGGNREVIDPFGDTLPHDDYHTNGEFFERVSARDLVTTLSAHLCHPGNAVLSGLVKGLALREIAGQLKLSYPTALKYRRKIADTTVRLGIAEPACAARRRRCRSDRPAL